MSKEIKKALEKYDLEKVDIFVSYLNKLKTETDKENKLVNWWFDKVQQTEYIDCFKKVYNDGLCIDGDTITLNYRKKLMITYDYHAYINKVLITYPETIFDFQLVHEGDSFNFRKESGKVEYDHLIVDPFNDTKKIIGAYGVIKNSKGEFLETLNMKDIEKMKNTSTMKFIWDTWYDRMVLKSIIKRICSIHFKDVTKVMDEVDNESNEPSRALISEDLQKSIEEAKDYKEIGKIYKDNIATVEDKEAFINLCGDRKKEFKDG